MDYIDFGYSIKNFSLPSKDFYKYKLIQKTQQLMKPMRWKDFLYHRDNTNKNRNKNNNIYVNEPIDSNFKLKTIQCPPQNRKHERF